MPRPRADRGLRVLRAAAGAAAAVPARVWAAGVLERHYPQPDQDDAHGLVCTTHRGAPEPWPCAPARRAIAAAAQGRP